MFNNKNSQINFLMKYFKELSPKRLAFYLLFFAALVILIRLFFCPSGTQLYQLEEELSQLRFDLKAVKQVKYDVKELRDELNKTKLLINTNSSSNTVSPIRQITLKADGSHEDDPFLGNESSNLYVMAFFDFSCKPCRRFIKEAFPQLKKEFIETKKIKFIYRDYPLPKNPQSSDAAAAAHCTGEMGKYWPTFDYLYSDSSDLSKDLVPQILKHISGIKKDKILQCIKSGRYKKEIEKDIKEAKQLGVKGAPAFFIGKRLQGREFEGVLVRGAQPYGVIRSEVLKLLEGASTPSGGE